MALFSRGKIMTGKLKARSKSGTKRSRSVAEPTPKQRLSATSLPWKKIKNTASFAGIDEGGGMMMLEELDDVGVEWEEEGGARIARFVTSGDAKTTGKGKGREVVPEEDESDIEAEADEEEEEWKGIVDEPVDHANPESVGDRIRDASASSEPQEMDPEASEDEDEAEVPPEEPFKDDLLPEWKGTNLHSSLKRALLALGFVNPTEIQSRAIPGGTAGRDIIGVAETGSGKTLAYSLPILSHLLRTSPTPSSGKSTRRPLAGLILCPTRELALQVVDHLQKVVKHALDGEKSGPPRLSIGSVVGGLSAQKQKRIVERGCDVLVATPGRLWDLIKTDEELAMGVRRLRFLVIDEADRMIENGHFAELENIVRLTQRSQNQTAGPDDDDPIFASTSSLFTESSPREDMQTFVFSATLSKDLQHNLKKRYRPTGKKAGKKASALEDLVERLDFRDENPEVIDLSPEGGVVKQLKESMIECVVADKDLYLYYFLLRYPGRSLVFVGSIDGIRRLVPLFETLHMPIYPLHSQLQQKQRLKNLDRFKSSTNGILIATDVAARGLDIPNVEHVVHFNLPRTADAYIHRSGRTARAQNPGFALQLCAPEEKGMQRALMKSLGRDAELPDLPIEGGFLPKLRERITLAREIEKAQHQVKKDNHDRNWLIEAAEAMDLDIDPDMLSDRENDPDAPYHKQKKTKGDPKAKKRNVPALKEELRALLAEPLMARGVSAKYPTSGSKVIVNDLVNATGHGTMLGASTVKAYDEVHKARVKVPKPLKRKRQA